MFRQKDSRRLPYDGHLSNDGPIIERRCDACGKRGTDLVPVLPSGPPVVPGTGAEIPPFVCRDFRGCCSRFLGR